MLLARLALRCQRFDGLPMLLLPLACRHYAVIIVFAVRCFATLPAIAAYAASALIFAGFRHAMSAAD